MGEERHRCWEWTTSTQLIKQYERGGVVRVVPAKPAYSLQKEHELF